LMCLDGRWNIIVNDDERDIAVPASWNEQYSDLYNYFGIARYKKEIFIPVHYTDKRIWLRFGSVATKATVYVNGIEVCYNEGTALPFECEITDVTCCGQLNIIEVDVDNTLDPWGIPPAHLLDGEGEGRVGFYTSYPAVTYDFFPYGGIHRSVYLYTTSQKRIEQIKINTLIDGTVHFVVILSEEMEGTICACCGDVEQNIKFAGNMVEGTLKIDDPQLWDCENPYLYALKISLFDEQGMVDVYVQSFGIREIKVSGKQLLLNNKPIFLRGFGKHEDFHIIGKGFNHGLAVKDFSLLKWIGANSFRTSHYPYDEEILSYADRNGILIIGETPFVGLNSRMFTEEILAKANAIIEKMIDRDFNHPSVIMWSLANEPTVDTKEGEEFFKSMYDTARRKDVFRPITYVAHLYPENNLGMKYYDLMCVTRYVGWYYVQGNIEESLSYVSDYLDRWHNAENQCILVGEFGADAVAGMHSEPALMFSEEYQAEIIKKQYEVIRSKDYVVGAHVWAFADFKTAQAYTRVLMNRKGVFTRERYPKMAAHMLKELWNKEK